MDLADGGEEVRVGDDGVKISGDGKPMQEDKEKDDARPNVAPAHKKAHLKGHRNAPYPAPHHNNETKDNNSRSNNNNSEHNSTTSTTTTTTATTTNSPTPSLTNPPVPPLTDPPVDDNTTNEGDESNVKSKRGQKREAKSTPDKNDSKSTKNHTADNTSNTNTTNDNKNDSNNNNNGNKNEDTIENNKTTNNKNDKKNGNTNDTNDNTGENNNNTTNGNDESSEAKEEPTGPINLAQPLGPTETFQDTWNNEYVKLPFSSHNNYRKKSNPTQPLSRWHLIETVLKSEIADSSDFEEVVQAYNSRKRFDFSGLHDFFDSECNEDETREFFAEQLPKIISLALLLPSLIPRPIPLLVKHVDQEILLSQHQIASLLANAFLCTFPNQGSGADINVYPSINFNSLFEVTCTSQKAAKLKAILHYFRRVTTKVPTGFVSFHRQVLDDFPEWDMCDVLLSDLRIEKEGAIEDKGDGLLQVDFANKLIGGGVLGSGSVQEEIRFVLNPELIISRLFTSSIEDNEAVIIKGAERFSVYKGYSTNFEWVGDFEDKAKVDDLGRLDTTIVAMDAVHLKKAIKQYSPQLIERELNKAYCGFHAPRTPPPLAAVATGNWGCGVFGGDRYLKSILQLMAAAVAHRDVVYFTFSDNEFGDKFSQMFDLLKEKKVTVGKLFKAFTEFHALISEAKSTLEVFDYLDLRFNS